MSKYLVGSPRRVVPVTNQRASYNARQTRGSRVPPMGKPPEERGPERRGSSVSPPSGEQCHTVEVAPNVLSPSHERGSTSRPRDELERVLIAQTQPREAFYDRGITFGGKHFIYEPTRPPYRAAVEGR